MTEQLQYFNNNELLMLIIPDEIDSVDLVL